MDAFIIMHPSLGYYADDYGLRMIAIEKDGKVSGGAAWIEHIVEESLEHDIKLILYQTEFDSSQAKTIGSEIDGKVIPFESLSSDYTRQMKDLTQIFVD